MKKYITEITNHYSKIWGSVPTFKYWEKGPISDLPPSFCVLEFRPTKSRKMWTYATCGMSQPLDRNPLELHLFSPVQYDLHVELLTIVAHFHRTAQTLDLGHTVNFGRTWIAGSNCEYGLISLPYLDGPLLQVFRPSETELNVQFLWLVPISKSERDFKKLNGLEALEEKFEKAKFNYLDPFRQSVV